MLTVIIDESPVSKYMFVSGTSSLQKAKRLSTIDENVEAGKKIIRKNYLIIINIFGYLG